MSNGIDANGLSAVAQVGAQILQAAQLVTGYEKDLQRGYKWWEKQQNAAAEINKGLADYTNSINVSNWKMQNEYNSPAAQMARYAQAGLNPDLIYSQNNANPAAPSAASTQAPNADTAGLINAANGSVSNRIATAANMASIEESKSRIALNNAQADKLNLDNRFNEQTFEQRVLGVNLSNEALESNIEYIEASTDLSKTQKTALKYEIERTKQNLSRFKLDVAEQIQRISNMSEEQRLMQYEQILKSKLIDKTAQEIVNLAKEAKLADENLKNQKYIREQLQAVTKELYTRGELNNAMMSRLNEILPFEKLQMLSGSAVDAETMRLMERNSFWNNLNGTINSVSNLLTGGAMMYVSRGRMRR